MFLVHWVVVLLTMLQAKMSQGINASVIKTFGPYGTGGDLTFVTSEDLSINQHIKTIELTPDVWGIFGFTYTDGRSQQIGSFSGGHGTLNTVELEEGEVVTHIEGTYKASAKYIGQILFKTNKGKTFGPYGDPAGTKYCASGRELKYFSGLQGSWMDLVSWHFCDFCCVNSICESEFTAQNQINTSTVPKMSIMAYRLMECSNICMQNNGGSFNYMDSQKMCHIYADGSGEYIVKYNSC